MQNHREDRPVPAESIKQEIAEKFLNALRSHNWELMRTIMAPDIVWSLPGSSRISGEAHGVDAVIARCQIITSYGLNFGLKHVLYGQFGFALSLNNTAKRGDLVLDEHLATVCSLHEERISRIDTYLSDVPMANAFFA
jgi:ketosteroid isomerase-like protein